MQTKPIRKLFSAGELLTLAGVVLVVMSAANTWANAPPKTGTMVAATYVATFQRDAYLTSGYSLKLGGVSVGWIIILAALAAGSLLLVTPTAGQKRGFLIGQIAAGVLILILAVRYVGLYMGVLMALAGAGLLIAGAVLRYGGETAK